MRQVWIPTLTPLSKSHTLRDQIRGSPGAQPQGISLLFSQKLLKNLKLKRFKTNKHNKSQLITCHCYGFVQTKATSLENESCIFKAHKKPPISKCQTPHDMTP